MADSGKLSMDRAGMQGFIDDDIQPFQDGVRKITQDDPTNGPSMASIIGTAVVTSSENNLYGLGLPLAIGLMGSSGGVDGVNETTGPELNAKIVTVAQSVINIYNQQTKLFGDLHDNLKSSIDALFDAQHHTLVDVDGRQFLDDLGLVSDDFQSSGTSGGSSSA